MLQERYPVKLSSFAPYFLLWVMWMTGWITAKPEELVWGPLKWIVIALFAPIGIILLGSITGYRIDLQDEVLRFGFYPFLRSIPASAIDEIRTGGTPFTLWKTDNFITVVTKKGERVSLPCKDAKDILSSVRPVIEAD